MVKTMEAGVTGAMGDNRIQEWLIGRGKIVKRLESKLWKLVFDTVGKWKPMDVLGKERYHGQNDGPGR